MSACCVILTHVTWALAREWALFIQAAKTVTWALTREWALAWDTMVHAHIVHASHHFNSFEVLESINWRASVLTALPQYRLIISKSGILYYRHITAC